MELTADTTTPRPIPEEQQTPAPGSAELLTYRFSNLPHRLKQDDLLKSFLSNDRIRIVGLSVAPSPLRPWSESIATVTFRGKPSFAPQLVNGEGDFSAQGAHSLKNVKVDDAFYGLTPLNSVRGDAKAEYLWC